MKPYYNKNGITIYHGDCFDILPTLESVDLVLTDMPYNLTSCNWDKEVIDIDKLWKVLKPLGKENTPYVFTASQPFTSKLVMSNSKWFKYEWIWHKNFSGGFITAKKKPMKYHENVLVFYQQQPTYNPQYEEYSDSVKKRFKKTGKVSLAKIPTNKIQGIKTVQPYVNYERGKYPSTVQFIKSDHNANNKRVHPTQKPVSLGRYLILTYTNPGDLILDPFGGSHSFAVAALLEGRRCISIEKDEHYCEIGKKRLEDTQWERKTY